MAGPSTTSKVTTAIQALIATSLMYKEGVIVRYKGMEVGIWYVGRDGWANGTDGHDPVQVPLAKCTIRKATVEKLRALHCVERRLAA